MSKRQLFTKSRTIYWPSEFTDIANILKGTDESGKPLFPPMFRFNTGIMVLAAAFGLANKRQTNVGTGRQEISTDTFEAHDLAGYVLLIPLLAKQDIELLRPEREDELVSIFEQYAAGGFEYMRGILSESADTSGQTVLQRELQGALDQVVERQQGQINILGDL